MVAANVGALIAGESELTSWETFPPLIAIPLGPEGGAGFIGDGVADAATIAELKGRHMLLDTYAESSTPCRVWLRDGDDVRAAALSPDPGRD